MISTVVKLVTMSITILELPAHAVFIQHFSFHSFVDGVKAEAAKPHSESHFPAAGGRAPSW